MMVVLRSQIQGRPDRSKPKQAQGRCVWTCCGNGSVHMKRWRMLVGKE